MRWRKPCLRFRLLTFGWNVLFMKTPGNRFGTGEFGPGKAEKMDLWRLLRAGDKVKGQKPSRKKPWPSPRPLDLSPYSEPVEKSDSA